MILHYDIITSLETVKRLKKGIDKLVFKFQMGNIAGFRLGVVVRACNASTLEAETGEL